MTLILVLDLCVCFICCRNINKCNKLVEIFNVSLSVCGGGCLMHGSCAAEGWDLCFRALHFLFIYLFINLSLFVSPCLRL